MQYAIWVLFLFDHAILFCCFFCNSIVCCAVYECTNNKRGKLTRRTMAFLYRAESVASTMLDDIAQHFPPHCKYFRGVLKANGFCNNYYSKKKQIKCQILLYTKEAKRSESWGRLDEFKKTTNDLQKSKSIITHQLFNSHRPSPWFILSYCLSSLRLHVILFVDKLWNSTSAQETERDMIQEDTT